MTDADSTTIDDDDEDRGAASFLRGLTLGALIGAVIAGSSLWFRRRHERRPRDRSRDSLHEQDPAVDGRRTEHAGNDHAD